MVVIELLNHRSLEAPVANGDPMIEALVTDTTHPTFRDRTCFWRANRCSDLPDAQRLHAPIKCDSETAVTVVDQEFGRHCGETAGLNHLLRQPLRVRMCSDPDVKKFSRPR